MIFFQSDDISQLIKNKPQRIVSLVPSQTELLYDLGLNNKVVGITKFCIHPNEWFRTKTRIGGTKNINIDKVKELNPDLILANKEENTKEQIEELEENFNVWVSDIHTLEDALDMIEKIGQLTHTHSKAIEIKNKIESDFLHLQLTNQPINKSALYLIWRNPYISVGGDTFINDMIEKAGFSNAFKSESRYPEITLKKIAEINPEYIFLSSEPYPFTDKHIEEINNYFKSINKPAPKTVLVDGEMFSWYGSRLVQSASYFNYIAKNTR